MSPSKLAMRQGYSGRKIKIEWKKRNKPAFRMKINREKLNSPKIGRKDTNSKI